MTLPLRPNVCMLVYNKENRLFLGERASSPGVWQFPQGGAEAEFTLEENVYKELGEELGANKELFKITKKLKFQHDYTWTDPPEYYKDTWSGQSQTFWIVEFLGEDSDIILEKEEFMSWKWCSSHEVKNIADPIRIPGYIVPLREFEDFLLLKDEGFSL